MAPAADEDSIKKKIADDKDAAIKPLDAQDIAFLKNYGLGPYAVSIKKAEQVRGDVDITSRSDQMLVWHMPARLLCVSVVLASDFCGNHATATHLCSAAMCIMQDVKDIMKRVNDLCGVKESDTGLAPPSR